MCERAAGGAAGLHDALFSALAFRASATSSRPLASVYLPTGVPGPPQIAASFPAKIVYAVDVFSGFPTHVFEKITQRIERKRKNKKTDRAQRDHRKRKEGTKRRSTTQISASASKYDVEKTAGQRKASTKAQDCGPRKSLPKEKLERELSTNKIAASASKNGVNTMMLKTLRHIVIKARRPSPGPP